MYSTVSRNYETSLNIIINIFAVYLDFDRYTVSSLKRSSCVD